MTEIIVFAASLTLAYYAHRIADSLEEIACILDGEDDDDTDDKPEPVVPAGPMFDREIDETA